MRLHPMLVNMIELVNMIKAVCAVLSVLYIACIMTKDVSFAVYCMVGLHTIGFAFAAVDIIAYIWEHFPQEMCVFIAVIVLYIMQYVVKSTYELADVYG